MENIISEKLEDLELTRDEVDRLGAALKKDEFRKLFAEYCDEVTDPKNKKIYQDEITILEKERGVDVTFINPEPGYVIKTSVDGNRKAFINVCHNEHVQKPKANRTSDGVNWELPHTLSPPRDDLTKDNRRCTVYDVVFHPDTLQFASRNAAFKNMVTTSACQSVENKFNLNLDQKNLKFPKIQFKGMGIASVIRKKIPDYVPKDEEEETIVDKAYPYRYGPDGVQPKQTSKPKSRNGKGGHVESKVESNSSYATPKYTITQRNAIDLQDFTDNMASKMNATIPNELVVSILLPLLNSTADVQLDVTEKLIILLSEKPAKYKLQITLPYCVDENSGNAKFDKKSRKLVITLPVIRKPTPVGVDLGREDSGVESDHGSPQTPLSDTEDPTIELSPLVSEICTANESTEIVSDDDSYRTKNTINSLPFLNPDFEYSLPDFTCHMFQNILAITLHIKNVEPDSVEHKFIDTNVGLHIKFSSMGSGFYSTYYAFCIKFPAHHFEVENVVIETWDNNVIVQIPMLNCDIPITKYWIGSCEEVLVEHDDELIVDKLETTNDTPVEILSSYSEDTDEVTINIQSKSQDYATYSDTTTKTNQEYNGGNMKNKQTFEKAHSLSESSGDELSSGCSPSKSKGILKHKRSSARNTVSRSVSESSVDDFTWSNSLDNYNGGSELCIPEEKEAYEQRLKKTVRFNDVIERQVFRLNSSILGQKKKNQRKNKNKKRAHDRRHSESELSETDERKEKDTKLLFRKDAGPHSESELSETEDRMEFKKLTQISTEKFDSGLSSDPEKENMKLSTDGKEESEVEFKSDLIFQLDI